MRLAVGAQVLVLADVQIAARRTWGEIASEVDVVLARDVPTEVAAVSDVSEPPGQVQGGVDSGKIAGCPHT